MSAANCRCTLLPPSKAVCTALLSICAHRHTQPACCRLQLLSKSLGQCAASGFLQHLQMLGNWHMPGWCQAAMTLLEAAASRSLPSAVRSAQAAPG